MRLRHASSHSQLVDFIECRNLWDSTAQHYGSELQLLIDNWEAHVTAH